MKTHPRHCKPGEQPCTQEHIYVCRVCSADFETEGETFYKDYSGRVLPNKFWPVCSLQCYRVTFNDRPDTNPNGIAWKDLPAVPSEGIDPSEPIDFNDLDDLAELERIILNEIMDTNEEMQP